MAGLHRLESERSYVNLRLGWSCVDPRLEENGGVGGRRGSQMKPEEMLQHPESHKMGGSF